MTVSRLRDTFALLLREGHGKPMALSAEAERTIGRRVAIRWARRIGALAVVGALGTAAVAGAYGDLGNKDEAAESAIPTPTFGKALVTFPVTGGPEFASAAAGLKCGDPAPIPHPKEHDLELALMPVKAWNVGDIIQTPNDLPAVAPYLTQTDDADLGIVANSGISLIVSRNGVIAGVSSFTSVDVGWNSPTSEYQFPRGGQYSSQLIADWIPCPGEGHLDNSGIEPGTYDIVAITRVFSTPESVALYQELGFYGNGYNLDPDALDPQGIYLPGSYDCELSVDQNSPARACLPDYTTNATYTTENATVTMLYDTKDFVQEFSTVLVSEPLTVTIPGKDDIAWMQDLAMGWGDGFDSVDDFTCGASANHLAVGRATGPSAFASLDESSARPATAGSTFVVNVLATGISDGSVAELMPGARVVYVQNSMVPQPGTDYNTMVQTVVGWAAASATTPFTVDRFAGPRPVTLTADAAAVCPDVDAKILATKASPVLVGTWRVMAHIGTFTDVDFASELSTQSYGSITYFGG